MESGINLSCRREGNCHAVAAGIAGSTAKMPHVCSILPAQGEI